MKHGLASWLIISILGVNMTNQITHDVSMTYFDKRGIHLVAEGKTLF